MNVGWIGLGALGTYMVRHVLKAGHPVTVYPRGAGLAEITALGARECPDYAALAARSDLLVLTAFDDRQVRDILFDNGALGSLRPGSILAIHTTGSPAFAREIGEKAPPGVDVLDATFSGGPALAEAGALTLMVGGSAKALERARPAFASYCEQIFPVGPLGQAQLLKLLNNLLLAANIVNAVKLLELAESYGFETMAVAQIVQACSGASFAMRMFQAAPAAKVLEMTRPYLEKDVALAVSAAKESGLDIGVFAPAMEYFEKV